MSDNARVSRRDVMAIAMAVGPGLACAQPSAVRWGGFGLADPVDGILAYGKMRADLSGKPAIWHHLIDMYALIEGRVSLHLFRREGVSVHKVRVVEGGLVVHYVASTYTVGDDGAPMKTWTNPISNREVRFRALAGAKGPLVRVTPAGAANDTRTLDHPSAEIFRVGRPETWGDRISITDDMLVYRTAADQRAVFGGRGAAGEYAATELGAYEADIAAVQDAAISAAPCSRAMVGVVPWSGELGMDDINGRLMIRHRARKMPAPDSLPAWLASRVEADTPGMIKTPDLNI